MHLIFIRFFKFRFLTLQA